MLKPKEKPVDAITRQIEAHGFSGFVAAAATQAKLLEPGSTDRIILEYLLENAVGEKNAKSWKPIHRHLRKHNVSISKNKFQTNLLQRSRRSTFYIGSSHQGYFLINSESDVAIVRSFYQARIYQEVKNLESLDYLSRKAVPFLSPEDPEIKPHPPTITGSDSRIGG